MGSLSIWHWLIILGVVVLVFGTKKLGSVGSDVGSAIKNFKKAMNEGEAEGQQAAKQIQNSMSGQPDAEFPEVKAAKPAAAPQDKGPSA